MSTYHPGLPIEGSTDRWINLHPSVVGLITESWIGMRDPLYAIGSRYIAGMYAWDVAGCRTLIRASVEEIDAIERMAREYELLECEGGDCPGVETCDACERDFASAAIEMEFDTGEAESHTGYALGDVGDGLEE